MALTKINNNTLSAITGLPAGVGGKVLQIQSAKFTDNLSTNSTSYVASTITDSITPSATSSKILILVNGGRSSFSGGTAEGSSNLYYQVASGSFNSVTNIKLGDVASSTSFGKTSLSFNFLHSPNTTSALTYKVYYKTNANTYYLNADNSTVNITLMEISGWL